MPNLAANLSMLFTEHEFLDRFHAAAKCGFKGVEILFPYEWSVNEIGRALKDNNLEAALFTAPPGALIAGDRGVAAIPGRESEFISSIQIALDYAAELNCRHIHVMAGKLDQEKDRLEAKTTFIANLKLAAPEAHKRDVVLLIEPINNKISIPGYFLNQVSEAREIIEEVRSDNVRLQFDLYHAQIMHGNLEGLIRDNIDITRHFQIAGLSARKEPNLGELNYPYLLNLIDSLNYTGWIGCEYHPNQSTISGLGWASEYGIKAWDVSDD